MSGFKNIQELEKRLWDAANRFKPDIHHCSYMPCTMQDVTLSFLDARCDPQFSQL